GEQKVTRSPHVEDPQGRPRPGTAPKRESNPSQAHRCEIAIGGRRGPGNREIRRDDARNQKGRADEAKNVKEEDRPRGVRQRQITNARPDRDAANRGPGQETEQDAGERQQPLGHRRSSALRAIRLNVSACISTNSGTKNVGMMLTGNVTRATVLEVGVLRTPSLLWEK